MGIEFLSLRIATTADCFPHRNSDYQIQILE